LPSRRDLPHADLFQKTVTVAQFEPLSPAWTRVTISCTGGATDAESGRLVLPDQLSGAQAPRNQVRMGLVN
jgi:hypothetical protein